MPNKFISIIAALVAFSLPDSVQAQAQQGAMGSISSAYWCDFQPSPCPWPAQPMSITQSENELSSYKAWFVSGGLPWNLMQIIIPDQSVRWPNGANDPQ
jgi:hypothetical protein